MIIQRLFSSKEQKARRAKWDKKVAEDIWGKQADEKTAKRVGRDSQKQNTVSLDKKSGKARVNYENAKIQDLTKRESDEILNGTNTRGLSRNSIIQRAVRQDLRKGGSERITTRVINKLEKLDKKEAGEQLKKNLNKGGKIALATGGVVAAGIGAKKLADNKKAKKDDNSKK